MQKNIFKEQRSLRLTAADETVLVLFFHQLPTTNRNQSNLYIGISEPKMHMKVSQNSLH